MAWRGPEFVSPAPPALPGPWPGRVDAFLSACAMHAGQRERDTLNVIKGIGDAAGELMAKK